ncbi:sugar phosphate isomerase/epimerase family protein [Microlunatus speluncae]|uniref:sugar phosphate isomerase/epimerase family protein n=1 Tax=Microlunatus speluncae TaxID=2594267 RepID=UPI001266546D|nr:sugar phosphate isomerase/epimerase family protein [Microlunatus speluncae]
MNDSGTEGVRSLSLSKGKVDQARPSTSSGNEDLIGLGSYAFFWRHSDRAPKPLTLIDELRLTREAGLARFQICDYGPLLELSDAELRQAKAVADELGMVLELGTKGVAVDHLSRFVELAVIFEARLLRSMVLPADLDHGLDGVEDGLRRILSRCADAGVTLALETYEQLPSTELVALIEQVGDPALGICLDPANNVAGLEQPRAVVERCAPYTKNVHVKDFAFTRSGGWIGFTLEGAPLGTGLLDLDHLLATVDPVGRGISMIVEHWLTWRGDFAETARLERDWTDHTITRLEESLP